MVFNFDRFLISKFLNKILQTLFKVHWLRFGLFLKNSLFKNTVAKEACHEIPRYMQDFTE